MNTTGSSQPEPALSAGHARLTAEPPRPPLSIAEAEQACIEAYGDLLRARMRLTAAERTHAQALKDGRR